jgi:tetratricopeptide (TPR) repeat protein
LGSPWRRRRPLLLALLLILMGAATAGVFLWLHHQCRAAERALDRYAFDEARQHLDLYLRVRPGDKAAQLLAAQAARRGDAYEEAERHLAACLRDEGMTDLVARERLLLSAQQGDLGDMEGLLQVGTGPDNPEAALVLEALAKGYLNRAWDDDALACLTRLLERRPDNAPAWLLRAGVWERRALSGEPEHEADALHDYEKAAALAPSSEARRGRAAALYRTGRPWEALVEYERLRREKPDDADVLLGLARCRYNMNEADEARRLLDALLEQHPDHPAGLLERGRLAFHAGELTEAERLLDMAVERMPPCDLEGLRLLGRCLEDEHKEEEASRRAGQVREREADLLRVDRLVLQANRNPTDVALRYEIALEQMRLGREREGVAALFLVLEQQPKHGPAHAALADYFERTGQPARAARHRRAARPVGQGNP